MSGKTKLWIQVPEDYNIVKNKNDLIIHYIKVVEVTDQDMKDLGWVQIKDILAVLDKAGDLSEKEFIKEFEKLIPKDVSRREIEEARERESSG